MSFLTFFNFLFYLSASIAHIVIFRPPRPIVVANSLGHLTSIVIPRPLCSYRSAKFSRLPRPRPSSCIILSVGSLLLSSFGLFPPIVIPNSLVSLAPSSSLGHFAPIVISRPLCPSVISLTLCTHRQLSAILMPSSSLGHFALAVIIRLLCPIATSRPPRCHRHLSATLPSPSSLGHFAHFALLKSLGHLVPIIISRPLRPQKSLSLIHI